MNHRGALGSVIVVSIIFALGGLGYIYVFSPVLGNEFYLNPTDAGAGIQMSPSANCQKVCVDGVFMGCEGLSQDLMCGLSCRGVVNAGSEKRKLPNIGSTLCEFVNCVCN
ncbi:hypothetical protein J4233_00560 [Candidatus Pacearchaeota archaeon]|nr:hypothetical protein [Candidatus Pacearchaeota archaeon]